VIRQVGSKPVSPEVRRNLTVLMGRLKVEPCGVHQHGDHEGGKNDTDETPPDPNSVNARTTVPHKRFQNNAGGVNEFAKSCQRHYNDNARDEISGDGVFLPPRST
jgi:hypothetical protein